MCRDREPPRPSIRRNFEVLMGGNLKFPMDLNRNHKSRNSDWGIPPEEMNDVQSGHSGHFQRKNETFVRSIEMNQCIEDVEPGPFSRLGWRLLRQNASLMLESPYQEHI